MLLAIKNTFFGIDIGNYKTKDRFLRYSSSSRTSRVYAVVRYCQLKVHNFNITLLVIHTIFKTWVSSCVISSNHPDLLWSANEKHLHISKITSCTDKRQHEELDLLSLIKIMRIGNEVTDNRPETERYNVDQASGINVLENIDAKIVHYDVRDGDGEVSDESLSLELGESTSSTGDESVNDSDLSDIPYFGVLN
ncbi:hypothetical protein OUZ56_016988 [Daphnia magna]|uniref:Uncharacterized protein n=1 Tax=Daphnia magna TaxID=35525 RepID=A0ABR0ARV3_9CRUS|nr:hypothetical protein OUZ56_016988 [Daphnia magna]